MPRKPLHMSLAIIGANYLQKPLVEKAKEMGLHTLCFAWEDGAVCKDICDEFYPISIIEKDEILKICQTKHIDGICTIASDVAAPTVAYVAEQMGLVGNSYECACRANNKFQMREVFMRNGIDCPKYKCITNVSDGTLGEVSSILELPIIVKPTDRSGSLGVKKVDKWEDLPSAIIDAINLSFAKQAIVEEYIEGHEISVEFISYQGKHYPLQITDKVTTGAPHFVELEHHQPANLPKEMFERIYSITDKALTALGVTNGASHSEYRITDDGRIVVMEIGARMGGDFIGSDLVRLSTGYDFVEGVIRVAMGEFEEPRLTQSNHSGVYFLCEETKALMTVMNKCDEYPEIVDSKITDVVLRSVTCSADRSGYIIYRAGKKINLG